MNAYCYLLPLPRVVVVVARCWKCAVLHFMLLLLSKCFFAIPKSHPSHAQVLSLTTINCIWKWLIFHLFLHCPYMRRMWISRNVVVATSECTNATARMSECETERETTCVCVCVRNKKQSYEKVFSSEMAINILRHLINRQNSIKFYFQEWDRASAICRTRTPRTEHSTFENCPNVIWKCGEHESERMRCSNEYQKAMHNHQILMATENT